jgi:hypothetical protein
MDRHVDALYELGATERLIAVARESGDPLTDSTGAYLALRLLTRLGDPQAAAFCAAAGLLGPGGRTRAVGEVRPPAAEARR